MKGLNTAPKYHFTGFFNTNAYATNGNAIGEIDSTINGSIIHLNSLSVFISPVSSLRIK
jgi:hypothetical protein